MLKCRGGTWYSAAAHAVVASARLDDPVDAIRALAQGLVSQAEVRQPPTDLDMLGSFRGVVEVVYGQLPNWGMLEWVRDRGYRILLNDEQGKGRARFSHAHEISHTLIPTHGRAPKNRQDRETGMYGMEAEEEYLCDIGASELLMPTSILIPFIATRPAALETVKGIADTFAVSLEAAGRRLVECQESPCAIIFWEEKLKPAQEADLRNKTALPGLEGHDPQPRLRVRFGICSPAMRKHYFPPSKSIEDDSPVRGCLDSDAVVRAMCHLPTGRGAIPFRTESVSAPYRAGSTLVRRVITVAHPMA